MLSEKQCKVLGTSVNNDTDIPFMHEEAECLIIEKVIDKLNPHIEPALQAICPPEYVSCLKLALAEGIPLKEKRTKISCILRSVLSEPLANQLAGVLDFSLVPERLEQKLLNVVTNKLVEELVEWTVGEIDDHLGERELQQNALEDAEN